MENKGRNVCNLIEECFVLVLPTFDKKRRIHYNAFAHGNPRKQSSCDIIIGRDLLETVRIDLLFSKSKIAFDGITIPMQPVYKLEP